MAADMAAAQLRDIIRNVISCHIFKRSNVLIFQIGKKTLYIAVIGIPGVLGTCPAAGNLAQKAIQAVFKGLGIPSSGESMQETAEHRLPCGLFSSHWRLNA